MQDVNNIDKSILEIINEWKSDRSDWHIPYLENSQKTFSNAEAIARHRNIFLSSDRKDVLTDEQVFIDQLINKYTTNTGDKTYSKK